MKSATWVLAIGMLASSGCASVRLKPADFSWSFESVLTTDADGYAKGEPKTIAFNAGELFRAETKAAGTPVGKTGRVIRDAAGYYYLTSEGFRHVYIFAGDAGELKLKKKVLIDENGMDKPFFNRRERGIEVAANGKAVLLNRKGIVPGVKK